MMMSFIAIKTMSSGTLHDLGRTTNWRWGVELGKRYATQLSLACSIFTFVRGESLGTKL